MGASIYSTHFRPGDVDMWLTVFSGETGRMLGVLCGKALSLWKTGATAAVATRHLARAGCVARGHRRHRALCAGAVAVPCDRARPFRGASASAAMPTSASLRARSARRPARPAHRTAAASARRRSRDADIVVTITTSATPVVLGEWLGPGSHGNAMGQHAPSARELDTQAIRDADVFVDAREQAFAEKGEILVPVAEGAIARDHVRRRARPGRCRAHRGPHVTRATHRVLLRGHGPRVHDPVRDADRARRATAGIGQPLDDGEDDA